MEEITNKLEKTLQQAIDEDYLYEFASIANGNNNFIAVNADPSRGWHGEEYFKVYNNDNARKADKVIRIKFRSAEYVYHKNSDGKKDWNLNSKEKKSLIKLLQTPSKFDNLSNWQYAILQFNLEAFDISLKEAVDRLAEKVDTLNQLSHTHVYSDTLTSINTAELHFDPMEKVEYNDIKHVQKN